MREGLGPVHLCGWGALWRLSPVPSSVKPSKSYWSGLVGQKNWLRGQVFVGKFSTPAPFTGSRWGQKRKSLELDRIARPAPQRRPAYGCFTTVRSHACFPAAWSDVSSISDGVALAATCCGLQRFESHYGNEPFRPLSGLFRLFWTSEVRAGSGQTRRGGSTLRGA